MEFIGGGKFKFFVLDNFFYYCFEFGSIRNRQPSYEHFRYVISIPVKFAVIHILYPPGTVVWYFSHVAYDEKILRRRIICCGTLVDTFDSVLQLNISISCQGSSLIKNLKPVTFLCFPSDEGVKVFFKGSIRKDNHSCRCVGVTWYYCIRVIIYYPLAEGFPERNRFREHGFRTFHTGVECYFD